MTVAEALGVGLVGRRARLERVRAKHVPELHAIAQSPGWQLTGHGMEIDAFAEHLWSSSPVQFSVIRRDNEQVIGLVRGLRWDQRSRTIEVVAGLSPDHWRMLWPLEGAVIFGDYLFRGLGMRKLYFELRPSSMAALGSWVRRNCTREWVKSGEWLSPEGEPEDVELWSLSSSRHELTDRLLGRSTASIDTGR